MKTPSFRRAVAAAALLLSMLALGAQAQERAPRDATWVREGTDWTRYTGFYLKPLVVNDIHVIRPPWAEDDERDWSFEIEDKEAIQRVFEEAMRDELQEGGAFTVVDSAAPDALEVDVEILTIMPYLRPADARLEDDQPLMTLGTGELTGMMELRDATTRRLLLLVEDDTVIGDEYKEWTTANKLANLDKVFRAIGEDLRSALERAKAGEALNRE